MRRYALLSIAAVLALAGCPEDPVTPISGGDAATDAPGSDAGSEVSVHPDVTAGPLPLFAIADMQFTGAFRVSSGEFGASDMNYSEGPIAYNAAHASVYLVGHAHQQAIAEFAIPELVDSTVVADLHIASTPLQDFAQVLGRAPTGNDQSIDRIGGMALVDGELVVNAYEYYDAAGDNTHTTLVIKDPSDLAGSAVEGYFSFDARAHASGWLSPIPEVWQGELGATWITGSSSGVPIIGRLSVGPSAFTFDPASLVGAATAGNVATTTLLDFSLDNPLHPDRSNDNGDNAIWTHLTRAIYGFIAPGTRTYVTLGHTGGHGPDGVCYKCTPIGGDSDCGGYCAGHVDDYELHYWLWDLDDLMAVRSGSADAHSPRPYDHGTLDRLFPTNELGGASFDPATGRLFVTFKAADREQGQYANPPVIAVYTLGAP